MTGSNDAASALLAEAGEQLERSLQLAGDAAAAEDVVRASARAAARLALCGLLRDRGIAASPDASPGVLAALLQEAGLRPPAGVAELLGIDGPTPARTAAVTAAMAAVTWSSASRRPV